MAQDEQKLQAIGTSILVTGGNKGIGLELVKQLLSEHDNVTVIVGCRDLNRVIKCAPNKSTNSLKRTPELSIKSFSLALIT